MLQALTPKKGNTGMILLHLTIERHHRCGSFMASGPITPWETDGETVETMADFYFFGLQNHCRW